MEALKATLKWKLYDLEHLQSDLEALPRGVDIITQSRAIESWYNAWVQDAFSEKIEALGNNGPFFINKPRHMILSSSDNDLHRMIQREARNELFKKRDMLCLLEIEIKMLEELLCRNSSNWSPPSLPSSPARPGNMSTAGESMLIIPPAPLDHMISLTGYQKAVSEFAEYLKVTRESNGYLLSDSLWVLRWFTTKLYAKLSKHEDGGLVPVSSIMQYVLRKVQLHHLRLELMKYDADGTGYFTKDQLTLYLNRQWRSFTRESHQSPLIRSYIDSIVSETFFLLDPHRTCKIKIVELLGSRLLPQIRLDFWDGQMYRRFSSKLSIFKEYLGNSLSEMIPIVVFCEKLPEISQRIWRSDERVKEKRVRFSPSIVQRLVHFYEISGNKENMGISFNTFMDITFAWENLGTCLSSICFFFRALDTDDKGYLEECDLQRHYRNIEEILKLKTRRRGYSLSPRCTDRTWITPSFNQIQNEIKDFLAREAISRITPENLYKAKDGHIVIAYLMNLETSVNNTLKMSHSAIMKEVNFFKDLGRKQERVSSIDLTCITSYFSKS